MVSHWRGDPARPALAADVFRSGAIVAPPDLFESISCQICSHSQVVRRIFDTYMARLNARLSAIARVGPAFCAPRTGPRMNKYGKPQEAMSNVSSNASHRYDRPGHRSGHYRYRPRNSDARKLSRLGQVGSVWFAASPVKSDQARTPSRPPSDDNGRAWHANSPASTRSNRRDKLLYTSTPSNPKLFARRVRYPCYQAMRLQPYGPLLSAASPKLGSYTQAPLVPVVKPVLLRP
ncbi:hypothetical protein CCHR01_17512 [Colletotrichum chrysophilum]|uniref:Uncharacterized protein n=1 Tax=Colletotrichum chrysophilum TaxID=1836956 RepID=A0AAD9A2C2_9PEZI|nr:hypothetical protein CCHR01_17512 [Colletotrichum chrysophilum]